LNNEGFEERPVAALRIGRRLAGGIREPVVEVFDALGKPLVITDAVAGR
jgi:hypothetical protein